MIRGTNWDGGRGYFVEDTKYAFQNLDHIKSYMIPELAPYILGGCGISGGDTIDPGVVYIDGRLIYFEGQSGLTFPVYMVRDTDVNFETRSYDIDGNTQTDFIKEKVAIQSSQPGSGQYITFESTGGKTIVEKISEALGISTIENNISSNQSQINNNDADISNLQSNKANIAQPAASELSSSAYTNGYDNSLSAPVKIFKDTMGFVHWTGTVDGGSRNTTGSQGDFQDIINNLPTQFRPAATKSFPLDGINGLASSIQVDSDGTVGIEIGNASKNFINTVDVISYYVGF